MNISKAHAEVIRRVISEQPMYREETRRMLREAADLLDPPNPDHSAVMDMFKGQLLICLLDRVLRSGKPLSGDTLKISIQEVDEVPANFNIAVAVREGNFILQLVKKA